jgi:prepilin-type N-terminal cleavage/methylation domain-containing protein
VTSVDSAFAGPRGSSEPANVLVKAQPKQAEKKTEVGFIMNHKAFTIIEILIVVALLAIAGMMVVPMMSSAASMQIHSAANMIAADLEYAKSMAISRGQNFSVVFDKAAETYQIKDQNGNVIPHPVKKGFNYVIDFRSDRRLNRVDIVDANFDATNEVKFDYLGSPYNGNVPPTPLNSGVISLQAAGITKTIRVEPVTGYISIGN